MCVTFNFKVVKTVLSLYSVESAAIQLEHSQYYLIVHSTISPCMLIVFGLEKTIEIGVYKMQIPCQARVETR